MSKQVVDYFFEINVFAIFSFAYSLMNFANIFVTAISTVVYPMLKQVEEDKLKGYYPKSVSLILIVVFCAISLYYPLDLLIQWIFSKYNSSLPLLVIIFPGLAISSVIQIVKLNYFKALKKIKEYLITGTISLILAFGLNVGAYYIFKSLSAIAYASVLSLFLWYLFTDLFFIKKYKIKPYKDIIYILIATALFYLSNLIGNIYIGFSIYLVSIIAVSLLLFWNTIVPVIKNLFRKNKEGSLS